MSGDNVDKANIPKIYVTEPEPSSNPEEMDTAEEEGNQSSPAEEPSAGCSSEPTSMQVEESSKTSEPVTMMDTQNEIVPSTSRGSDPSPRQRITWPNLCAFNLGDKKVFYFKAVPVRPIGTEPDALVARKMFFINLFENIHEYLLKNADMAGPSSRSSASLAQIAVGTLAMLNDGREKVNNAVGEQQPPAPSAPPALQAPAAPQAPPASQAPPAPQPPEAPPMPPAPDFCAQFNNMQIDPENESEEEKENDDGNEHSEEVFSVSDDDSSVISIDYDDN